MRRFAVVLLCVLALPASARAWTWPVDGPVLRPFVFDPAHPYAGGQHRGIDIGAAEGTPVRAPADGTVTFAGSVPGGGKTIAIETPFGYSATLLHLGSIAVSRGCASRATLKVTSTRSCSCRRAPSRRRARPSSPCRPRSLFRARSLPPRNKLLPNSLRPRLPQPSRRPRRSRPRR